MIFYVILCIKLKYILLAKNKLLLNLLYYIDIISVSDVNITETTSQCNLYVFALPIVSVYYTLQIIRVYNI